MKAAFIGIPQFLPSAYPPALQRELAERADLDTDFIPGDNWASRAETLREAEVLFATWGMPQLTPAFLDAAPRLRAVFYAAGSVKCFATAEAYERGIIICSAWAANAIPVAEYSIAAILLSLKGAWRYFRRTPEEMTQGGRLPCAGAYHSSVGLVSLGAVGKAVARRLAAFEVNILASDPFADPELASEMGISLMPLDELFRRSDVVSIHTPWLPETERMITGGLVRSMRHGASLINTARGAVVDEPSVCEALRERPDLTAILDVTHPEPPLPDSPLLTLPNVFLTPHIAGSMDGEIARMGRWMADEFLRFLQGSPLKHTVSQEMLAKMA